MFLAKVIGKMVSIIKHSAYDNKKLLIVKKLDLNLKPIEPAIMAVDYVGAGEGDIVLVSRAPGLAQEVFGIENAPMCELIIAIVDDVNITQQAI